MSSVVYIHDRLIRGHAKLRVKVHSSLDLLPNLSKSRSRNSDCFARCEPEASASGTAGATR